MSESKEYLAAVIDATGIGCIESLTSNVNKLDYAYLKNCKEFTFLFMNYVEMYHGECRIYDFAEMTERDATTHYFGLWNEFERHLYLYLLEISTDESLIEAICEEVNRLVEELWMNHYKGRCYEARK